MKALIEMLPLEDSLRHGQIGLANEARLTTATFSEPLTQYLVGWQAPPTLQALLDFVAPAVTVGRRFEFKKAENSEAFLSESDDERAIGADFKRVEFKGTTVNEKTVNKGLTYRLDHDEEDDNLLNRQRIAGMLTTRLMRNEVRRAITALLAIDNSGTASNWGTTSPAEPDTALATIVDSAGDSAGINPNRVLYSQAAWLYRLGYYRRQEDKSPAALTVDQVAQINGMEMGRVTNERYQSSVTAKSKVMTAGAVVVFHAENGVGKDDPSNIKRFVSNTRQGGALAVHVEEKAKQTLITVEHYSKIVVTSTLGAKKLNVTNT